ncbi:PACE efflux transporter [Corynebacterium stationis]|uniref:PACE efflux transporter n=1 Tax=Corynebacterium stationis TaxID=1705 RepID=UPI0017644BE2|nr:PACE efflux transporter [Corynebacterium stationis]HHT58292.1 PACE efflux transporter [Corynebacterium stationis]
MSATTRRIVYVIAYELVGILAVTCGLSALGFDGGQSGAVAIASSTVAVTWNFIWTSMFEAWERRQESQTRTVKRRIVHAIGFEGGLTCFLIPVVAWVLKVSLLEAFFLQASILVFFLIYTFVFMWVFDKIWPPYTNVVGSTTPVNK